MGKQQKIGPCEEINMGDIHITHHMVPHTLSDLELKVRGQSFTYGSGKGCPDCVVRCIDRNDVENQLLQEAMQEALYLEHWLCAELAARMLQIPEKDRPGYKAPIVPPTQTELTRLSEYMQNVNRLHLGVNLYNYLLWVSGGIASVNVGGLDDLLREAGIK